MTLSAPTPTSIDFLLSPTGCGVSPGRDRQRAILRAIEERRLDDAARRLEVPRPRGVADDAPADLLDDAWESLIRGFHALAAGQTTQAEASLFQAGAIAAAVALSRSHAPTAGNAAGSAELAAIANLLAGRALRRQERAAEAMVAHECAAQVATHLGSGAILWAARVELAQDAALTGDALRVEARFLEAVQATDDPMRQAHALTLFAKHLTGVCVAGACDPERAAAAARQSANAWQTIDAGSVEAFRAARLLGEALLSWGECSLGDPRTSATELIREARTHLQSAREGLEPFGEETDSDVREIDDLLAVAERVGAAAGA